MMAKILGLSSIIHSKFENESQLAKALGWSRQRLWKITNGKRVPSLAELDEMSSILGCSIMDIAVFYLPQKSTTVDN
jgi:transcriptional regulator with XRE-family HTH domain